ncbi:hypothetical protein BH11ARM1_BH11ARM1_10230 [soil metagenome]
MALLLAVVAVVGCSSGAGTDVTKSDEEKFKNPPPVDRAKADAASKMPKGPAFIGEPTGATNPGGSKPPASVTGG